MNITILGATGNFGRLFTSKLLAKPQYQLTLLSKSASNLYEDSHRVTAKNVNAVNLNQLEKALNTQDLIYCAVSGTDLPAIAENLVKLNVKRVILMNVVGIYNELSDENGGEYNLDNEAEQIPNSQSAAIIEKSDLDYTILRCGFLVQGDEDDYVITKKGETPKGYITTSSSVEKIALEIIENPELYSRESISITKDMSQNNV